jgi:hypothetical protein
MPIASRFLPSSSHIATEIATNIGEAVQKSATEQVPVGVYGCIPLYRSPHVSPDRQACIAKAAYFRAGQRGFGPGHELDDWLAAEEQVDERLAGEGCIY